MRVTLHKHIIADPAVCHGKPTFKGTRVMVWQVLEMLAGPLPRDVRPQRPRTSAVRVLRGDGATPP